MSRLLTLLRGKKAIDYDSIGMICCKCGNLTSLILDNKNSDIGYCYICKTKYNRRWE